MGPQQVWPVAPMKSQYQDIIPTPETHAVHVTSRVITVLGFNFIGEGMRDAADPYAS